MRIDTLQLTDKQAVRGWFKDFGDEVLLVRQIFTNKDGSTGILNLVCSGLTLEGEQATTIYKKRWKVEEFHKSFERDCAPCKDAPRTDAVARAPVRTPGRLHEAIANSVNKNRKLCL